MSTTATQENREVAVTSALGKDRLLFRGMSGCEKLGRPFEFRLQLLSPDPNIDVKKLLATGMSTTLRTASGGSREFNGIVSHFSVVDYQPEDRLTVYEAVVRPRLWLLTRSSHCRFFYRKSVLEIARELLDEGKIDYEDKCMAQYPQLDNCVQFCETDFDFLSRMLEREGIFYYFVHREGKDTLVLADSTAAYVSIPNYESISFDPWTVGDGRLTECIYQWKSHVSVTTMTSQLNAFDFRNAWASDNAGLIARASAEDGKSAYATEDYVLRYTTEADGRRHAQTRIDAHQIQAAYAEGKSFARAICPGAVFRMTDHPRGDQNGDYLVTEATYSVESDYYMPVDHADKQARPVFDCSFSAIPKKCTYRSQWLTPVPIGGLQTARVVAPASDEIDSDQYGGIKVQFHWEQFNPPRQSEQTQRCWVRVAQNWAGNRWGTMFLPRVGQEVIVAFLDNDLDHPVVVGCVYNSTNKPPYSLPENSAVSTICSASVGSGQDERNELRFNDRNLQLLMYAGGRFDSYIKENAYTWIGHDRHLIVQGTELVKVGALDLTVSGSQNVRVDDNASLNAGGDVLHKAGLNYVVDGGADVCVKGAAQVVIEADAMLTMKSGGSFITVSDAGVYISGPVIGLNSGGAAGVATGGQPQTPGEPRKADDGSSVQ